MYIEQKALFASEFGLEEIPLMRQGHPSECDFLGVYRNGNPERDAWLIEQLARDGVRRARGRIFEGLEDRWVLTTTQREDVGHVTKNGESLEWLTGYGPGHVTWADVLRAAEEHGFEAVDSVLVEDASEELLEVQSDLD